MTARRPAASQRMNSFDTSSQGDDDKRQRVSLACLHCRQRKIKCNAAQPECDHCVNTSHKCEYKKVTPEQNRMARERKLNSRAGKVAAKVAAKQGSSAPTKRRKPTSRPSPVYVPPPELNITSRPRRSTTSPTALRTRREEELKPGMLRVQSFEHTVDGPRMVAPRYVPVSAVKHETPSPQVREMSRFASPEHRGHHRHPSTALPTPPADVSPPLGGYAEQYGHFPTPAHLATPRASHDYPYAAYPAVLVPPTPRTTHVSHHVTYTSAPPESSLYPPPTPVHYSASHHYRHTESYSSQASSSQFGLPATYNTAPHHAPEPHEFGSGHSRADSYDYPRHGYEMPAFSPRTPQMDDVDQFSCYSPGARGQYNGSPFYPTPHLDNAPSFEDQVRWEKERFTHFEDTMSHKL